MWTSTQMKAWFETEWAGVAQVFRLRRDVKDGEHEREEIVYGLTNLLKARKPMPLASSPYNKPIGGSKNPPLTRADSLYGKMPTLRTDYPCPPPVSALHCSVLAFSGVPPHAPP